MTGESVVKITNEEVLVAVVKRHESTPHYDVLNFINRVTQLLQLEREKEREREKVQYNSN